MDLRLVWSMKRTSANKRSTVLLAEGRCWLKGLTVVVTSLLVLLKLLAHLYFGDIRSFCSYEPYFGTSERDGQELFTGWHKMELFSSKMFDWQKLYCSAPSC